MADTALKQRQIDELISHVLALRKDFVQELLQEAGVSATERRRRKAELRDVLRELIANEELTVPEIAAFLDRREPGGKQHVFLLRPKKAYNDQWRDLGAARQRLTRRRSISALVDGEMPVVMPEQLTLSTVRFTDQGLEVVAVEARRYFERDEAYDRETTSDEGLPVDLRAYVERVARSTVLLRWDVLRRHAALHITQASGRGLARDHYRQVLARMRALTSDWLDLGQFEDVDLHKAIHELQDLERGTGALTRSRGGDWETSAGSHLGATSASTSDSLFKDKKLVAAIDEVSDASSGQAGNLYWLAGDGNPLTEDLHINIIASDSRINFMKPSSEEAIAHVLDEIRKLL